MSENSLGKRLTTQILAVLDETFESVQGIYLDKNTTLLETLTTITAEEASRPTSANCASIAAHVAHVTFYIEALERYIQGEKVRVDWAEIWQTVREVTPEEWTALQDSLREAYQRIRGLLVNGPAWDTEEEIGGMIGIVVHTAYHLGEIRQALCTIQALD